jgi:hypothetical protein
VRRVPPSTVIREEIDQLLRRGVGPTSNIISTLADLGLRYIVQHGLEQEQEDFLGRAHYERRDESPSRGFRNSYEGPTIKTAEGEAPVRVPQVREADEPYRSKLMDFLDGNSDVFWSGSSSRCTPGGCRCATSRTAFGTPPGLCSSLAAPSRSHRPAVGALPGVLPPRPVRVRRLLSLRGLHLREPAPLRGQGGDPRRLAITSGATPSFKGAGHCLSERWPRLH